MFSCVLSLIMFRGHTYAGRPHGGLPTSCGRATRAVSEAADAGIRGLGLGRCVSDCKITHFFGSRTLLSPFFTNFIPLWKRNGTTKIMSNVECGMSNMEWAAQRHSGQRSTRSGAVWSVYAD